MEQNKHHSYNTKELPKGCQYCVKGEKVVLFVTGKCPRKCYFCPVSDHKFGNDVIYANERDVKSFDDIVKEAKVMDAKGAGITGGDPLMKLERTCEYITKLKEMFGKEFHIHLYTSLNLVTEKTLQQLYDAGLDEIRFHFDLDDTKFWDRVTLARKHDWDVGVEIPCIPNKEKEMREMIDFIHDKVQFVNLNELEVADNELSKLNEMGYKVKDRLSYGVQDSVQAGVRLIQYGKEKGYSLGIHLCTAKLKDSVQLANRLQREAEGMKKPFDLVDSEGMLTRGAVYLPELCPGFGYREKLKEIDSPIMEKLEKLYDEIKEDCQLQENELFLDRKKPRLLLSVKNTKLYKEILKEMGLKVAIVTEYPTADQLEMEVEFL
ncbi:TPA: radical SAM protein [Candidatus Woesearchaeota archaeon]|nr:radical SAM protein [archaeon]HIJ11585.1 radical SAM protein [Candidatus Woesearchaeota archaeon]|tara:strand:- start:2196 stop:3326 length:1131 start_codon:yes stop_codon:yes gene_type:complete